MICRILSLPFLFAALSHAAVDSMEGTPPNIVLILVDDVGTETIGAYGGESYATPRIDELVSEGLRFDNLYVDPVCHPTRISLMTGRYLSNLGNPRWGSFPEGTLERETLAWGLRNKGYATAISGKWHLAKLEDDPEHPHRLGFDTYCLFGWHEGPRYWQPRIWQDGRLRDDVHDRFGPDVYLEFLEQFMEDEANRPFFAYYSMTLSHAVSDDLDPHPPHGPDGRYMTFAEMLAETDLRVGKLMDFLEETGLATNTLVLFLTDNGTSPSNFIMHQGSELIEEPPIISTWRGRQILGGKKTLTDWGIRVPAVAVWPGRIEPGTTTGTLVDVTDILPTILEIAGVEERPPYLDGRSFSGLLAGEDFEEREWIVSQMDNMACIRTKEWKLTDSGALYDMVGDPFEENPIYVGDDTTETRRIREQLQLPFSPIVEGLVIEAE